MFRKRHKIIATTLFNTVHRNFVFRVFQKLNDVFGGYRETNVIPAGNFHRIYAHYFTILDEVRKITQYFKEEISEWKK